MGILQEYRFYLIIAVLAITAILFYFVSTSEVREYIDFDVKIKESYASLKGNSDGKTLNQIGDMPETLFGNNINENIYYFDEAENISKGTRLPLPEINDSEMIISFIIPGESDNIESVSGDGQGSNQLNSISKDWTSGERGFSLDLGGYVSFSFANKQEATSAYDSLGKGELIDNTLFIPFQKIGSLADAGVEGTILYDIATNIKYTNIIGKNILNNSIPLAEQNERLYLLQNGILFRYFNEASQLSNQTYSASKGMGLASNDSYGILADEDGNIYKKFFSDQSAGQILFTDIGIQSLGLYEKDIYYSRNNNIYKRNLDDINTEISIKNSASTYFEIKGDTLLYSQANKLYTRNLLTNTDLLISSSDINLWGANESYIYYKNGTTIIKRNIDSLIEETLNIDTLEFKVNKNGLIYKIGNDIYNESGLIDIDGQITPFIKEDSIVYVKDADTLLYDLNNPTGYEFDSVIWEANYDITGNDEIKILLNNDGINSQTISIANKIENVELLDTATTDNSNIILGSDELIIDNLLTSFSTSLTGQDILDELKIGDTFVFGTDEYIVEDFFVYGKIVFDTAIDLSIHSGQKIYKKELNYTTINLASFYNIESLLGEASDDIYIKIELKEPFNQEESPDINQVKILVP